MPAPADRPMPRLLAGWPAGMEYEPRTPTLMTEIYARFREEARSLLAESDGRKGRPKRLP